MRLDKKLNREFLIRALKIGIGSSVAIIIAELIGLPYATSAGIVALLSIQTTKKATYMLAVKRVISYIVTIVLLAILWNLIGSKEVAFAIFMIILSYVSLKLGFFDGVSVNAVVGIQAMLMTQDVTVQFAIEEALIIFIGTVVAVILNLYIPDKSQEIEEDIIYTEQQLKDILYSLAGHLKQHQVLDKDRNHVVELIKHIDEAIDKAFDNVNITLSEESQYYTQYLNMRKSQCVIMMHFIRNVKLIETTDGQTEKIADLMIELGDRIHIINEIDPLIEKVELLIAEFSEHMKHDEPDNAVSNARLFSILNELEEFVKLKKTFLESLSSEQINLYIESES